MRPKGRELANNATAVLVFPTIVKAGFGIGGEYGEGELLIRGQPAGLCNIASTSVGFQFGGSDDRIHAAVRSSPHKQESR